MSMGQSGESDRQGSRRSLKLGPKKAVGQTRTRDLPLAARRTCQGTRSRICKPPARLLQDENLQAQLATEENILRGRAPEENTNGTELPSTPPASRILEELIVPNSPEESWSGKESSRRSCKLSRTKPSSTDFEELIVPDSPEETWATPSKSLRTPLASNSKELVVPESPEEIKDPSHRPWKLRRTGIRKVHLESPEDGNNAGGGNLELSPSRIAKRSGKLRFKSPAVSLNSNRSYHCEVLLPVLAAEKTSSKISDQPPEIDSNAHVDRGPELKHAAGERNCPRFTDGDSILPAFLPRRRTTASRKPLVVISNAEGAAPVKSSSTANGNSLSDVHNKTPTTSTFKVAGKSLSSSRDAQTPTIAAVGGVVPLSSFVTGSGKPVSVSSTALKKARALLEDESKFSESHPEFGGAGCQGNLPLMTSKLSDTPFSAAMVHPPPVNVFDGVGLFTSFVTGSWRPVSVSSGALKKARELLSGELDDSESCAELDKAEYVGNVNEDFQAPKFSNTEDLPLVNSSMANGKSLSSPTHVHSSVIDNVVPIASFMTGTGKPLSVSMKSLEKCRALFADEFEETATTDGIKKASLHEAADHLSANHGGKLVPSPTPSFRTSSGRTLFISSEAMSRAEALLAPHGGGLDVARSSPEETNASRNDNVNVDGTPSRGRPCAAVALHPEKGLSNLNRKAKFEQPNTIISNSHQLMDLSSKPSSTPGVDYQRRNVSAFKRPRMWNQPDDIVSSKGVCGVNSCAYQPQSLNPFTATRGHLQLQPSGPTYLLERVCSSMSGPIKLRDYIGGIPASDSEVLSTSAEVGSITSDTAENYRILHVTGGRKESISSKEIWKLFLGLGADTRHASREWVANHYKWIIWKLASSKPKHPRQDARKLVTLDTVLQELKYRYDRELSGHRSAIRSITEGDSSASRRMVLRVSAIRHNGDNETVAESTGEIASSPTARIEVTDGWYRLNAVLDAPFTQFLRRGKLKVGQKIHVCGATLCCSSQPKPPLEAFQDAFLALHVNGTRRACWNARLGFCRGPFLPLAFWCIKPGGGLVPKTYVGVTRVYPILFKEISAAGVSIVRSARAEELASNQFEQRRANLVEESILKLKTSSNHPMSQKEKSEGYELFEAVERASEPDIIMADMTPTELKAFALYQAKREVSRQTALENDVKEALQQAGLYSRNVVRLLKVRVTGLTPREDRNGQRGRQTKEGTITIWDASDELDITEGSVYCVSGLRPGTWGAKSSSNEDRLHLQAYPSTNWRRVPEAVYDKHFLFPYTCRAATRLSEMGEKFVFREFDIAAAVLHINEPFSCGSRTNQWVFMSDGSTSKNSPEDSWDEIQILAVRLSLPSSAFAPVEPSLVGSVVGCCNLIQQPKDYSTHFLVAEASELSLISSNLTSRPVKHLQAAAASVSEWVKSSRWAADSLRILIQGLTFQGAH